MTGLPLLDYRPPSGMTRAVNHADDAAPGWSDRAFTALVAAAYRIRSPFTIEALRAACEVDAPPDRRAWGGRRSAGCEGGRDSQDGRDGGGGQLERVAEAVVGGGRVNLTPKAIEAIKRVARDIPCERMPTCRESWPEMPDAWCWDCLAAELAERVA